MKVFRLSIHLLLCLLVACRKQPEVSLPFFEEQTSGATLDLSAVWFTDSLHGYAAGGRSWHEGILLSTADGGHSWQTDSLLGRRLECVMFNPAGEGYACGQDGLLLQRLPNDPTWRVLRTDWGWSRGCFFPTAGRGVTVNNAGDLRLLGPTQPWQLDTIQSVRSELQAIWFSDSLTAHAVGMGWVLRSADGGRHWERLPLTGDFFRSVQFSTPEVGYICGYSGTLLKTLDGGNTWKEIRAGGALGKKHRAFLDIWFATPERGYVVGDGGICWRTADGGNTWAQVAEAPAGLNFTSVFAFEEEGWVVAEDGRIFHFRE